MILTLFAIAFSHVSAPANGMDVARFLAAIREVECHKWSDPGGAYAIQPGVWRDRTRLPYRYAGSPDHAAHVAGLHVDWLARQLRGDGYPVTVYTLAACWRVGFDGFRARRAVGSYAKRVENLYQASLTAPANPRKP
jgi:hypothetical protein